MPLNNTPPQATEGTCDCCGIELDLIDRNFVWVGFIGKVLCHEAGCAHIMSTQLLTNSFIAEQATHTALITAEGIPDHPGFVS